MGNNRVFDYTEIARIYGEMNTITGDSGDPTSIAGLLHKINEEFTEVVNGPAGEDELALKGDAASDLKNSWDNTVGDHFTKFVENFSAWSSAVAQSSGDYSQFEQAVKGIKSANPLGWNSGGATDTASATGFYSTALTEQEITDLAAQAQFYQLTGADYVDTGMVSYAKKKKVWNTVQTVLAVGSIVSSGCTMFSMVKTAGLLTPASTALVPVTASTALVPSAGAAAIPTVTASWAKMGWSILGGSAARWAYSKGASKGLALAVGIAAGSAGYTSAGTGVAANVVSWMNPDYDPATYMKGTLDMPVAVGEVKNINGADYTFVGSSNNGTNIYYDSDKNMVYDDGQGNLLPVTDAVGQNAVYTEGGNTVLNAGSELVGPQTTLKTEYIQKSNGEEYGKYFDELDKLNETSVSLSKKQEAAEEASASENVNVAVPGSTTSGKDDDDTTSGTTNATTNKPNSGNTTSGDDDNDSTSGDTSNNDTQGVVI